jgi:spore germination protein
MIIHVVQQGDTMESIEDRYGVSKERLIQENDILEPNKLAIGQTIVIVYAKQTYVIQDGDTLQKIADDFGVSIMQLLRNNPYLFDRDYIYPGETIVISYADEKLGALSFNGYAYPFIDKKILEKTLPFLTYVTIYSYVVTEDGTLNDIEDSEIVKIAREYGVMPMMMVTGLGKNSQKDIRETNAFLLDHQVQDRFISNILTVLKKKDYYGVNISLPYVQPQARTLFIEFMQKFTMKIKGEGYYVVSSLTINTFEIMIDVRFDDFYLEKLGQIFDGIMIITYEWGMSLGYPVISVPIDSVKYTLENIIRIIPPEKVAFGLSGIGYLWTLPYVPGVSIGQSIGYNAAVGLAYEYGATIRYNEVSNASAFQYISFQEYIGQVRDARGIYRINNMLLQLGLDGIGVWNIMNFIGQKWFVVNTQFEIKKVT